MSARHDYRVDVMIAMRVPWLTVAMSEFHRRMRMP